MKDCAEVVKRFTDNNVKCKLVEDSRGDFIAIFGYGNLTRQEIAKQIADNDLMCMFFESCIRADECSKRMATKCMLS